MHFRNYLVAVLLAAIPVTLAQSTDLTVIKLSNTTDDTGVTRFSATSPDADVFVVKSTLPPCIARVPFYVVGSPIVIVPIDGKVTAGQVDANGTTLTPSSSTVGNDSIIVRPEGVLSTIYNAECTPATYVAFYTSANYRTFPIPYALPLIGDFTLNATYADLADLLYPAVANKQGQWVANQACAKKCNLQLPASVQASG